MPFRTVSGRAAASRHRASSRSGPSARTLVAAAACVGVLVIPSWRGDQPRGVVAQDADPGGAERFEATAPAAIDAMVREARGRGMKGVAAVAFVPGGATGAWVSRMQVVDSFVLGGANVLGIAYGKLAEMADTLEDSGGKARPPLRGEYGYRGGAIRRVPGGYLLAAFSGGADTDDLAVANVGLDHLVRPGPEPR